MKAIELNPTNALYWFKLANAYSEKKEFTKVILCLEWTVELDPLNAFYWYKLGEAHINPRVSYFENNQYKKAIHYHSMAVKLSPDNPFYQTKLKEIIASAGSRIHISKTTLEYIEKMNEWEKDITQSSTQTSHSFFQPEKKQLSVKPGEDIKRNASSEQEYVYKPEL